MLRVLLEHSKYTLDELLRMPIYRLKLLNEVLVAPRNEKEWEEHNRVTYDTIEALNSASGVVVKSRRTIILDEE